MGAGPSGIPDQPDGSLLDLLLNEVVPRLNRLACGPESFAPISSNPAEPGRAVTAMQADTEPTRSGPLFVQALELAEHCERADAKAATGLVARLRADGVPAEALMLQLITPAAQHLGQGWVDDRISFTDVTIGAGLLQEIFSSLMDDFHAQGALAERDAADAPRGFFCTMPGASHRLGVQMVRAFFARAGWQTRLGHGDEAALISQMLAARPGLIALSLGSETDLRNATGFILRARHACRSFEPVIMVGGAAVPFFPSLVDRLDADIVSGDALDALARATELVKERAVGTR
jgi:methanogenic corrinoid protein MtbC1